MAEAYPGGAHAALASRRSSFRNSLRRLRPTEKPDTSFMRGVWKYEIFPSYVRVTNKQVLQLDAQCQELPPCPSVGQILSFKLPSFSFNTTTYGSRYFTVAFLFFGAEDNEVFLKPFFVMHSDQDIVLSVLNPRSLFIEKGKFTWYIVPIRLVKNPYLYLQILPGQSDIQLTRSCTQSGDKLNTSEPQIFLSGSPVTSQDECLPYLLAQHTPPFVKSYARIHTFPGKVCPVNAIRRGKGYVRVSVDTPDLKREWENTHVTYPSCYGVNKGEKGPLKLAARCQQHARAWHRGGRTGHTKHTNGDDETSECTVPGHWTMMHFFRIVS